MGTRDLEIARAVKLRPVEQVAETLGLDPDDLEPYGTYKAKVRWKAIERSRVRPDGALVLVTAMTPAPAGEGKSTIAIGLADGLRKLGSRSIVALRQPALGLVFSAKGGATGGGRAQVAPMEEINLHFTGDIHAVGAAHNLLAAMVDNHLVQGDALALDSRKIFWKRVVDMNDRALRNVIVGLGGPAHGVPRESGFEITEASELMAILCLATDLRDFKARAERVVVGATAGGDLVSAGQLHAAGAMAALVREALKPNLVQTLEGTPALVHGGPFGNIAHGCSSLIATRLGLKLAEVVVTEAGFATDLGAEKFVDIKCRTGGLAPACAVVVATVRAVKVHGLENLAKHIQNVRRFGLAPVVALNRFATDPDAEVAAILEACRAMGASAEEVRAWELGGAGATGLAQAVLDAVRSADPAAFRYLYQDDWTLEKKIDTIATQIYRRDGARQRLPRGAAGPGARVPSRRRRAHVRPHASRGREDAGALRRGGLRPRPPRRALAREPSGVLLPLPGAQQPRVRDRPDQPGLSARRDALPDGPLRGRPRRLAGEPCRRPGRGRARAPAASARRERRDHAREASEAWPGAPGGRAVTRHRVRPPLHLGDDGTAEGVRPHELLLPERRRLVPGSRRTRHLRARPRPDPEPPPALSHELPGGDGDVRDLDGERPDPPRALQPHALVA